MRLSQKERAGNKIYRVCEKYSWRWFDEASKLMMRQQLLIIHRAVNSKYSLVVDVTLGTRKSSQLWKSVKEDVEIVTLLYSSYKLLKK